MNRRIIVAVTGASGAPYAGLLFRELDRFKEGLDEVAVLFSSTAMKIWKDEITKPFVPEAPFRIYPNDDFSAPFASGSSRFDTLIICPCSMGMLGRIAAGTSTDLIARASDVMLKERRRLILVTRETPLNLIHIENMRTVTLAGGIICPASPAFYFKPQTLQEALLTVVHRIIGLAGFPALHPSWGENKKGD